MDELDRRIRALEAERLRPVPAALDRRVVPPERLAAIEAYISAFPAPEPGHHHAGGEHEDDGGFDDEPPMTAAEIRRENYLWLLAQGETRETAAARVGITPETGRQYEREPSYPQIE